MLGDFRSSTIGQDLSANSVSLKSVFIVLSFRIASFFAQHDVRAIRLLGLPVRVVYRLAIEVVMGVELPDRLRAGPGLAVFHGVGLVVNQRARLGANVTIRHGTTIGALTESGLAPVIGDGVDIGAQAMVVGDIYVGDNSVIGAGAILVDSCPPFSVIRGSKSKIYPAARDDG